MPKFTQEELKRLSHLKLLKHIPGHQAGAEKEIQQIYHEAERREDLELQRAANEESKKANKLAKCAIWISVITFIVSTTISALISIFGK